MKTKLIAALALAFSSATLMAQQNESQKPVKTGNEWKMPGDVVQRSRHFADSLKKSLGLNEATTQKMFELFMANTKPVDEITVTNAGEKERKEKLKANHEAFNEKLKLVLTQEQFKKYLKEDALKYKQ